MPLFYCGTEQLHNAHTKSTSKTSFEFMFLVIYSLVQFDSTTIYILYAMKYFMHMLSKFYRKIKLVHYLAFTLLVVFIQYIMTS